MVNAIRVIFPYQYQQTWVFDDEAVGLIKEPFVSGIPEMIDVLVQNIPDAIYGFKLLFSDQPFPDYQAKLIWQREEYGGHWYYWPASDLTGWLCPALFQYFSEPPSSIYCKAEALKKRFFNG